MFYIGPLSFYTFGLVFGIAICLGWFTVAHYFRTHGLKVNEPVLGVCIVGFGLLGAKLDSTLLSWWLQRSGHAGFGGFTDLQGGYTYLGAILLGTLAAGVYAMIHRLPLLKLFDAVFCVGLSYSVGRIGCFLAGDGDYGIPSTLPWAMSFPHGIVPTSVRVHPTMLYSSAWESTVFAILWHLSNPRRQPALRTGTLLSSYLFASGAGRFLIEYLGRNPVLAFGLTEAQLVSVVMMACGVLVLRRVLNEP